MHKLLIVQIVLVALLLTACGSSDGYSKMAYDNASYAESASVVGNYVDYSYTLNAEGNTKKTRDEMLEYYEDIQQYVLDRDGHMSYVNNTYNAYDEPLEDGYLNSNEKRYLYSGLLNFDIEIPNEHVTELTEYLEAICDENKFKITDYRQTVVNYDDYTIVDDSYDFNYWDSDKITEEERNKRVEYADYSVCISYYKQRSTVAQIYLSFIYGWTEFWDSVGAVVLFFLLLAVGIAIIYLEWTALYRLGKKRAYKHRRAHPEYYPPRDVIVLREHESIGGNDGRERSSSGTGTSD